MEDRDEITQEETKQLSVITDKKHHVKVDLKSPKSHPDHAARKISIHMDADATAEQMQILEQEASRGRSDASRSRVASSLSLGSGSSRIVSELSHRAGPHTVDAMAQLGLVDPNEGKSALAPAPFAHLASRRPPPEKWCCEQRFQVCVVS